MAYKKIFAVLATVMLALTLGLSSSALAGEGKAKVKEGKGYSKVKEPRLHLKLVEGDDGVSRVRLHAQHLVSGDYVYVLKEVSGAYAVVAEPALKCAGSKSAEKRSAKGKAKKAKKCHAKAWIVAEEGVAYTAYVSRGEESYSSRTVEVPASETPVEEEPGDDEVETDEPVIDDNEVETPVDPAP